MLLPAGLGILAEFGPSAIGARRDQIRGEERDSLVYGGRASLTTTNQPYLPTPAQKFVCNTGYSQTKCDESEDWKAILRSRSLDPDSPAFTYYPKRETFFDEALVTRVPVRSPELLLKWNMDREGLLDVAIRHELGHALCNEPDERNAERVAKLLEQRKPVSCEVKAEAKQNARHHASLN